MTDKRFSLTFDVNANIDPIKAAVNGLQQAFGKLKLSDSLQSSLDKIFSKLNDEIENFESLASKGFTNLGDISKAEKSFNKITDLLGQLKIKSKSITGLDPEKFLPKESIERVKELRKSWEQLKKVADKGIKIKAQEDEIKKVEQAVQKLTSQFDKLNSENRSLSASKGINTKQINEYKIQIEEARKAQAQLLESGEKKSGAEYQDLEQKVKSANAAIAQLERTNLSYDTTIQKNKATMNGLKTEISSTNASVTDMKNELTKLQDEAKDPEGLAQLRQRLAELKNINIDEIPTDLEEIKQVIDNLNSEELEKIKQHLEDIPPNLEEVSQAANECGNSFDAMKNNARGLDQTAREIENLHNQVLQFFSIGNAVQLFKRAVKSAFDTVKKLDATMTETAVVTDFTVGDMWKQLPTYSAEATKLGAAINDLYAANTLYYQQGLQTNAAMALGIETTKMARIANIETADATNLMTAALRGFNMELNETSAQKVNDIYSELAAITAANTHEIGAAMSKTASIASSANMELETTAALLSQIIETTREAPETAGTAMKTIIARFSEVKELVNQGQLTGEDTEGEIIDVNKIQGALRSVGISMNEFFKGTEGLDDVLLKLASKWDTLDFTTQRYIATTAAGSRQQSRFIAMMSDYSRTQELVSAAYNSTGASQEQFEKTLDSLNTKLTKLKNAWDQFAMGLANNEVIKVVTDFLTGLLNIINSIIDGISGGNGLAKSVLSLTAAFTTFKIGKSILGKSGITSILKVAFGKGTEKDAKVAGQGIAKNIGIGIGEGIEKIKKGELGKALLEKIGITKVAKDFSKKDLTKSFGLDQLDFSNVKPKGIEKLKDNIWGQVQNMAIPLEAKNTISAALTFGDTINIEVINQALEGTGYQIQIVGQDAKDAGAQVMKMSGSMETAATACKVAGLAFQGIASIMESLGADDSTIEFFRTFGSILMTLGPIMGIVSSVFTATGKKITEAGHSAQAAWWWVFLIIAAVAALTAGVIALVKAAKENSLAGQMEKAQKATEAAKAAAESAKTAYDDLLSARSEYSELQATLDGLTKGTNEWKQALIEANAQVLKLLSTYPELAEFIRRGEDGQLTILDKGFDFLIEKQQASMQRAQAAVVASQMDETRIQQKIDKRNIREQFISRNLSVSYAQGLMDKLSNILESGDLSDKAFEPLVAEYRLVNETTAETISRLRELCSALNDYDAALIANQTQLQAQAETLLMAGADQEILDSEYNTSVVTGFAKRMTTQDYADKEAQLSKDIYTNTLTEDASRKDYMEKSKKEGGLGIKSTGDELKDLQLIYKELSGLESIKDIDVDIAEDKQALANEIGKLRAAEDQIGKMEDFQKRLNQVNENDADAARNIAGLMSGDATNFTKAQLDSVGKLSEYAEVMGYADSAEMAKVLGYGEKKVSELDEADKQAYAKTQVKREEGMTNEEYQQAVDDWIAQNGNVIVTAEVQMDIDSEQYKEQMQDAYNKASAGLQAKGVSEDSYKDLSIDTVSNLSKQTANMSDEAAQKYVENFNKVLSSSNLGESGTKQLGNYLSTVDWSNMTEAVQAMDYMQSMGVDSDIIQKYWNDATDGANTYVASLTEAVGLMDRLHGKSSNADEIQERFINGEATVDDITTLEKAGVNLEGLLIRTANGWKMTEEAAIAATDALRDNIIEQAQSSLDQQKQAIDKLNDLVNTDSGIGVLTKKDEETGKLVAGDFTSADDSVKTAVANQLGVDRSEYNSEAEYWDVVKTKYLEYIDTINNQEIIFDTMQQEIDYLRATKMTAAENEASGGSEQSIIWSAQNEAVEAGLDANEMMQYADTLRQVNTELDEVTAAQVALANSKMNAGLGEIIDSYDEWSAVLDKDTGKLKDTSAEGVATYNKLKASVNKMLNTSEDLSDAFWDNADNMKNIEKAAKGDTKALGELQKAAAKDYILNIDTTGFSEDMLTALDDFANLLSTTELPTLKPGIDLSSVYSGTEDFLNSCNAMIQASGMTGEQVSNAFKNLGYDVEIDYEPAKVKVPQYTTKTSAPTYGSDGSMTQTSQTTLTGYEEMDGLVPVVTSLTSTGSGGGGISTSNEIAGASNKGKGGGGSGTKTWKNPYDKFYNTTEKINELLRDRNNLEREYDKLLSRNSTTVEQLNKNLEKQLKNLEDQIKSQKALISGKREQLINAANATMEVAEGRAVSFQQQYQEAGGIGDISQYAYYDENLGQIVINWDKLEALQEEDAEQGEAVEAYISYLEGIASEFEDAQDALLDIEDSITEIINQQLEERVNFIEAMRDLLVEQYQKRIDELSSLNDTINDSNQKILDGISESIELERQIRDNTKTEEDIADKEARLAYLRRDTSGANDLEIQQLEEELADMREGYSDTLIDQEIDRLTKQNDEAAEARQKQIDIMQAQLDYWQSSDYFNNLIESMDKNEATALWKELKGFEYKTEAEKIALMKEFNELWNSGNAGNKELAAADSMYQGTEYTLTDAAGNQYSVFWNGTAWVGQDANGNTFSISQSDIDEANINDKTLTTSIDLTSGASGGDGNEGGATGGGTQPAETYPYGKASETSGNIKQGARGSAVKAIQYALNKLGYGNSGTSSIDGIFGSKTTEAVKAFQKAMGIQQDGIVGKNTRKKFKAKQYLTGGLADYTGFAWLDGSKSKPELVLNAKDTENFIALKDILSDVLKGSLSRTKNGGDNYYDFHITVEEIANDYDVEKMIQKIKEEINNDARYRNVNAINLLR